MEKPNGSLSVHTHAWNLPGDALSLLLLTAYLNASLWIDTVLDTITDFDCGQQTLIVANMESASRCSSLDFRILPCSLKRGQRYIYAIYKHLQVQNTLKTLVRSFSVIPSQVWWLLGSRRHTWASGRFGELLHENPFQRQGRLWMNKTTSL